MLSMKPSRDQEIRDEFARIGGGMSTAVFARHCMTRGLITMEEREKFEIEGAQKRVRKALKASDVAGLPFAGQTTQTDEEGAAVWQPRQLWIFEDYELNVRDLTTQRDTMHWEAVALANECFGRFGRAPDVPPIGGHAAAAD